MDKQEYNLEQERLKREFFDRQDGEDLIVVDNNVMSFKIPNNLKIDEDKAKAEVLDKIIKVLIDTGLVDKKDVR